MTDARLLDPALFGDAAVDAETAKLNAQMIEQLTGQPEWWVVGARAMRAAPRFSRSRCSHSRTCFAAEAGPLQQVSIECLGSMAGTSLPESRWLGQACRM
jgi:hypothetical protein